MEMLQSQHQKRQNDKACAASWLGLVDGAEMPPEMATLLEELDTGKLVTCWDESTCWTAFAIAARKVGDLGDKTGDDMNGAVEATLEFVEVETGRGKLPSDFDTRDKAS